MLLAEDFLLLVEWSDVRQGNLKLYIGRVEIILTMM